MSVRRNGRTGKWEVRWREAGRQPSRSFDLKVDAESFERDVKRRQQLGTLWQMDAGRRTLADYVTEVWGPQHASHLAPNTRRVYAGQWSTHLAADLGQVALRDLTPVRIRMWQ